VKNNTVTNKNGFQTLSEQRKRKSEGLKEMYDYDPELPPKDTKNYIPRKRYMRYTMPNYLS